MVQFCKFIVHTLAMLFFLVFIGSIFVSMSVMLGKSELVFLIFFLLLGSLLKSFTSRQDIPYFSDLPLVGDATRILHSLEKFYAAYPPKIIFYYLFYPISSVINFFLGSRISKTELSKYFTLIHWVILVLFIEGFIRSYQLYQTFGLRFTVQWCVLEFVLVYFLCNLFAIPLIICTIRLSLVHAYRRLLFISLATMLSLGSFFYYFAFVCQFTNLIPSNIIIEKKLSDYPEDKGSFVYELRDVTTMFLKHHLPDLRQEIKNGNAHAALKAFNERYQEVLLSICPYEENRFFYFTTNRNIKDWWGFIFVPMRDSLFFAFNYRQDELKLYHRWQDIVPEERDKFVRHWQQQDYRPSLVKQLARVVLEETRDAMKSLEKEKSTSLAKCREATPSVPSVNLPEKNIARMPTVEQDIRVVADKDTLVSALESSKNNLAKEETAWVEVATQQEQTATPPEEKGGSAKPDVSIPRASGGAETESKARPHLAQAIERLRQLSAELQGIAMTAQRQRDAVQKQLVSLLNALAQWQNQQGTAGGQELPDSITELQKKWHTEWELAGQQRMLAALATLLGQEEEFYKWLRRCQAFAGRCQEVIVVKNPLQESLVPAQMLAYLTQCINTLRQKTPNYQTAVPSLAAMQQEIVLASAAEFFVVYDPAVASFNFAKSVRFHFISDHLGRSPEARSENRITQIFSAILHALLWFFGLCMPLHVALIVFSYWQYKEATF
jgi:hypothetical protein